MRYEWDENKRRANIEKHGIDFLDAVEALENEPLMREDDRRDYGERRCVAMGEVAGRIVVIVFTVRARDVFRIISARKANAREVRFYEQQE